MTNNKRTHLGIRTSRVNKQAQEVDVHSEAIQGNGFSFDPLIDSLAKAKVQSVISIVIDLFILWCMVYGLVAIFPKE